MILAISELQSWSSRLFDNKKKNGENETLNWIYYYT